MRRPGLTVIEEALLSELARIETGVGWPKRTTKRGSAAGQREAGQRIARVRFLEGRIGVLSVLEVDVPAAWNGDDRLRRALLAARIQEVSRQAQRIGDRVHYWLRVVELDGGAIRNTRRPELELAMMSLLETVLAPRRRRPG